MVYARNTSRIPFPNGKYQRRNPFLSVNPRRKVNIHSFSEQNRTNGPIVNALKYSTNKGIRNERSVQKSQKLMVRST